nr:MAG TPA: hypothetical protein [Bacteriophage sp.]
MNKQIHDLFKNVALSAMRGFLESFCRGAVFPLMAIMSIHRVFFMLAQYPAHR